MKKKQFRKLLKGLPETIDKVYDVITDEEIIMIDFMDGERVVEIVLDEDTPNQYIMKDRWGEEIDSVDKEHLLMNNLYT